jgi:hypothetical protein
MLIGVTTSNSMAEPAARESSRNGMARTTPSLPFSPLPKLSGGDISLCASFASHEVAREPFVR